MAATFDFFPWFKNFLINPVTDWQRFINPQFNVTINQGDAAVENHVLARAGSYGKAARAHAGVVDILLERLPPPLSATETRSVGKYPANARRSWPRSRMRRKKARTAARPTSNAGSTRSRRCAMPIPSA
jgi:hypothetical protein